MQQKVYKNRGSLFANRVKKKENSPDYNGKITVDLEMLGIGKGTYVLSLSGWKQMSKEGQQYLSLSVSKFEERKTEQPAAQQDEDIPF